MATESQFSRNTSERSSQHILGSNKRPDPVLDSIRQRAYQGGGGGIVGGVDFYPRSVGSHNTSGESSASSTGENPIHSYNRMNGTAHDDRHHIQDSYNTGPDTFQRAKAIRPGVLDHRNSYNEKILASYHGQGLSFPGQVNVGVTRQKPLLQQHHQEHSSPHRISYHSVSGNSSLSGTLYRSNSSLDIDQVDYSDHHRTGGHHQSALRRNYGSANSLDIVDAGNESFFEMLSSFRPENFDQRAPAPPQIHEVLRGKLDLTTPTKQLSQQQQQQQHPGGASSSKVANGSVPVDQKSPERAQSPTGKLPAARSVTKERKPRAKSVSGDGAGLFRKLRGTKTDVAETVSKTSDSSSELEYSTEEYLRRKALTHYDCQSVGVNFVEVVRRRNSIRKRRNTTTGASAASAQRQNKEKENGGDKSEESDNDDSDDGDGRSNELVLSCSFFRNELGGEEERMISLTQSTAQRRVQQLLGNRNVNSHMMMRPPACSGMAILDVSKLPDGETEPSIMAHRGYIIEHLDHGAFYYRNFFYNQEHQNYFGVDENLGPVALSIKRERADHRESKGEGGQPYQYRVIARTSELTTLRITILEDAIPSSSRLSSSRGLPIKEVLEYVCPEIQLSCLRQAVPGNKAAEQLMKLDEQGITKTYKIGVMYCKAGQSTEEELYNNEYAGPAFDEFLDCIGQRVRLKGFEKYRAGLDNKTDSTGTHSLYATYANNEVMFHVSTFLPYTPNNRQQLLRKRHIGNDIVTIVFQEPGALPFTPKTVRSHFQHVFILVQVYNPNTDHVRYSVAVSRSKDVPPFGPAIPEGAIFSKSQEFADFLLAKVINAENAAHKSEKFVAMATRTRQEYLKDLATNYISTTALESSSKLSKFGLGSGRKKERAKQKVVPDIYAKGGVVWSVQVEDFSQNSNINCFLAIAPDSVVVIEEESKDVVFTIPSKSVIGWTTGTDSIRIYYDHGECVLVKPHAGCDITEELQEIISRLQVVTQGIETVEMTLRRNGLGQLGFHVHYEGIVSDVEPYGFAWQAGLRQGSRLVEICKVATATLSHEHMVDLLRTSVTVKVVVIPPFEDGTPRRIPEDPYSSQSSLSSQHTVYSVEHAYVDDSLPPSVRSSMRSLPGSGVYNPRSESKLSNSTSHSGSNTNTLSSTASYGSKGRGSSVDTTLHQMPEPQVKNWSSKSSSQHSGRDQGLSQKTGDHEDWYRETGSTGLQGHHNNNYLSSAEQGYKVLTASTPGTGFTSDHMHQSSSTTTPVPSQDGHGGSSSGKPSPGTGSNQNRSPGQSGSDHRRMLAAISGSNPSISSSNLSQISDVSSLSSNSSHAGSRSRPQHGSTMELAPRDHGKDDRRQTTPVIGGAKSAFRRPYLDMSPMSSNSSSPKSNRNAQVPDDSFSARLRPGVSALPPKGLPPKPTSQSTMSFQEELMRLIDPDVSDAEIRQNKGTNPQAQFSAKRGARLQRTLSDESLAGGGPPVRGKSLLPMDMQLGSDVIFTTAVPAQVISTRREELSKEQRLSPRATTSFHKRDGHSSNSPILPLPDAASGLDWNNLVDAANKAFETLDVNNDKSDSGVALSDSAEMPDDHGGGGDAGRLGDRGRYTSHDRHLPRQANPSTPWRPVPPASAQRVQELEARCVQLQQELDKERQDKDALQMEVQQLRQDNLRLQEESQTAAAQLRKFTEWFFNTIDRQ
ncbi:signal-induced proliferation-associated 1-like protein 2 isoform X2 [Lingula anatina]|uniref:Signal-induced proliferation-associated 1-like protein 2 isoform X2 n=1 Tax=Lingula anatina TaxID=7574 RepID=A0A1S3JXA6_LINAN|nr:signal-induced proliferation-associated 1-like protein 2 isoform X2 [Lingula anatina]|eukprot:XP_013415008.1 signal-induced proliferation-associated 1-like protein 2 isoform X2 [Lingula anatina]